MNDPYETSSPVGIHRHHATTGGPFAISTSSHATRAALDMVLRGGSAVDGFIAAALVQCVVENGSTSLAGAFSVSHYEAKSHRTRFTYAPVRGAEEESYGARFFNTPEALTGRGMALPAFVDGAREAHAQGGHLPWQDLFDDAVRYAEKGFELSPNAYGMTRQSVMPCRYPEGRAIWMVDGRYLCPGERVRQPVLAKTLKSIAYGGASAFYEGEFAQHFVARAQRLGGRHRLADMKSMLHSARTWDVPLEGDYRGYQCSAPLNAMAVYAMHLNEAANLCAFNDASGAEAVYAKMRIMEEAFHASLEYGADTHARFISKSHAQERVKTVLTGPLRATAVDLLFKTNIVMVRDQAGNLAWGTHTINCPQLFGAGIVVDGVYAGYIMNDVHARGGTDTGFANGVWTTFALYKGGKPALIAGSPGFGFFHGPYQVMTAMAEFGMTPLDAVRAPRFGFGSPETFNRFAVEGHCRESVFEELQRRGVEHQRISPMATTGLVGAVHIEESGLAHVAQDPRRDGLALAL